MQNRNFATRIVRWIARGFLVFLGFQAGVILLFAVVNPPFNYYMLSERMRAGILKTGWVPLEQISPHMARAAVAAEDANFCLHWGFDLQAIKSVVTGNSGKLRGASTISQQVAKNVFLWPNRSWLRKGLEAETTLMIELLWTKRRIIEVYINVAEFDDRVFGVSSAAPHYFGVQAKDLTLLQAARLAAVLPNPKHRSASQPSGSVRRRTKSIMSGAQTIAADGRDTCFQVLK